ncbi:Lysosomal thioesterase PPT2-A [Oryzias melastigma]|uniref:Lysosomal thioesterase PPT2-A n=1 Tax=Oryzias melastigma TaxID=30732 RepID=A0A834EXB9_ORYME|nr:Lysosomal thioesterase PPT2-A [Oryzias melastigma]
MSDSKVPRRGGRWKRSTGALARLFLPLLGACFWAAGAAYKPVIIVHGLFDSSQNLLNLQRFINESHPGTNISIIDLFDGYKAWTRCGCRWRASRRLSTQ